MNEVSNVVRWIGDVNVPIYEEVMQKIEKLKDCSAPVTLMITSEGGYIPVAIDFTEEMRIRRFKFNTLGIGRIASAAIPIFLSGERRSMGFHSHLLFHIPDVSDYDDQEKKQNMKNWYIDFIIDHSNLSREKVLELSENETLIDAKQAKDFGLIDEII
ncbi:MAG: ATP-dependent Clp protease proteolytic subunit [Patescibacteria group bacterium]